MKENAKMSQHIYRVFLAHGRNVEDPLLDAWRDRLAAELQRRAELKATEAKPPPKIAVTLGRDCFHTNAETQGGWSGWMRYVAAGTKSDGQPTYHSLFVPGVWAYNPDGEAYPTAQIGKATANMIDMAMSSGRKVFLFVPSDRWSIHRIIAVATDNPRDFKAGWRVCAVVPDVSAEVRE